jgi:hypothetical protein
MLRLIVTVLLAAHLDAFGVADAPARILAALPASPLAARAAPAPPFDGPAVALSSHPVDAIVFDQLRRLGIEPARLCSDAVFVRRAFLDVIGTLPTATETTQFLQNSAPDKRRALIDHLLAREEFADYWAMKWGDLLRIKAEFPVNLWPPPASAASAKKRCGRRPSAKKR